MSDSNEIPPTTAPSTTSAPRNLYSNTLSSLYFFRFFKLTLLLTGLVSTCIICLGFVYLVFSLTPSKENLAYGLASIGLAGVAGAILPPRQDEIRPVETDVSSIAGWVLDCTGAKSVSDLPEDVQREMGQSYILLNTATESSPRKLYHLEHATLTLSQSLATHRKALNARADSAFSFWQVASIVTIVLGMFTTILVSMSSTEFGRGDGTIQRSIRILAIVFPALGTAAAAIIAFYSPQAEWSQASRTLASLTQLHGQMAIGIWKLHCMGAEDDTNATKVASTLDEWSRRYVDIQTVSTAAAASSSASAGGGQQQGGGGGQQPGGGGQQGAAPAR